MTSYYEGILKMPGASGVMNKVSYKRPIKPMADGDIDDQAPAPARANEAAAAPAAAAAAADPPAAAAAAAPPPHLKLWREGIEKQMIVNMIIVLELESLVSKQWQQQISGFQPGQSGGCSWKKFIGSKYIQEYQVI